MNTERITSIIRQILLAVGGFIVGKGWVDNETMLQIAGAVSVILGSLWALWTGRTRTLSPRPSPRSPSRRRHRLRSASATL